MGTAQAVDGLRTFLATRPRVAFDTETNTPVKADPTWVRDRVTGLALAWGDREQDATFLPVSTPGLGELMAWLLNEYPGRVIAHNAKFDLHMTRREWGVTTSRLVDDTMLMAHLLDENRPKGLKPLATAELGLDGGRYKRAVDDTLRKCKLKSWGDIPVEVLGPYSAYDAALAWGLDSKLWPQIQHQFYDLYRNEQRLTNLLTRMEQVGVVVDRAYLEAQAEHLAPRRAELERASYRLIGRELNLASDDQVAALLYDDLGWPVLRRTKNDKPSTDGDTLKALKHHVPTSHPMYGLLDLMLELREVTKQQEFIATLLDASQWDGRVHADFFSCGARTGRFSCSNPNLQQMPRPQESVPMSSLIRRAFVCDPGVDQWLADYDQVEMRGFAHYANEPNLIDAFTQEEDVYAEIAAWIYGGTRADHPKSSETRYNGKTVGLAVIYGASGKRIGVQLGKSSAKGREVLDTFFERSPRAKRFIDSATAKIERRGYLFNSFGRYRRLTRNEAYKGVNSLIQGWAADVIKHSMVRLDLAGIPLTDAQGLRLQVHDELRLDGMSLAEMRDVVRMMTDWPLRVPLTVTVKRSQTNWADAETVKL